MTDKCQISEDKLITLRFYAARGRERALKFKWWGYGGVWGGILCYAFSHWLMIPFLLPLLTHPATPLLFILGKGAIWANDWSVLMMTFLWGGGIPMLMMHHLWECQSKNFEEWRDSIS